jgi:hypothetical protein
VGQLHNFEVTFLSSIGTLGLAIELNRNKVFGTVESIFRTSFAAPDLTNDTGYRFRYLAIARRRRAQALSTQKRSASGEAFCCLRLPLLTTADSADNTRKPQEHGVPTLGFVILLFPLLSVESVIVSKEHRMPRKPVFFERIAAVVEVAG